MKKLTSYLYNFEELIRDGCLQTAALPRDCHLAMMITSEKRSKTDQNRLKYE